MIWNMEMAKFCSEKEKYLSGNGKYTMLHGICELKFWVGLKITIYHFIGRYEEIFDWLSSNQCSNIETLGGSKPRMSKSYGFWVSKIQVIRVKDSLLFWID